MGTLQAWMHFGQGYVTLIRLRCEVRDDRIKQSSYLKSSPVLKVTFLWGFDPAVKTLAPLPAILCEAKST